MSTKQWLGLSLEMLVPRGSADGQHCFFSLEGLLLL